MLLVAGITGCDTEVEVQEIRATALSDFSERGLCLSDDLVAGVMGRLEGRVPGTISLVLEPEDALLWARLAGGAVARNSRGSGPRARTSKRPSSSVVV